MILFSNSSYSMGLLNFKIRGKRAFTFVEILAIIAVIGLLAGIAFFILNGARKKADVAKAVSDMRAMYQAIQRYYIDVGNAPPRDNNNNKDDDCEKAVFVTGNFTVKGARPPDWAGPYITGWPKTPWGGTYQWSDLGSKFSISIKSIPDDAAQAIDDQTDDGNLSGGRVRKIANRFEYQYDAFNMPFVNSSVDTPCNP